MNENGATAKPRITGVVTSFLPRKGYGFIKGEAGEQIFVHFSDIHGKGFRTLEVGEEVEFTRRDGERGPQALDVVRLNPPPEREEIEDGPQAKKTW